MGSSVELSHDLKQRIDEHLEEGETYNEFIEELLNYSEAEGHSLWEGYDGPP